MSLVRCRRCDHVEHVGLMPGAACGLRAVPAAAAGAFAAWWVWEAMTGRDALGRLLAGAATALVAIGIGTIVFQLLPRSVEWVVVQRRPCPECGARAWAYPDAEESDP